MKVYNFEQRSPEWFSIRKLKMTASHASEIATQGKGLETYIGKVIAGFFAEEEKYTNEAMERGVDLESEALLIYELEKDCKVDTVGFIEHNEHVGCSPDGLVGEEGGIEIKCHNAEVFLRLVCSGEIDSKYEWQVQMNLLITKRSWWDYVGYCPELPNPIYIKRIFPNIDMHQKLLAGFQKGKEKIIEKLTKVNVFMGAI
jgi:hypothetical protein